MPQDPDIQINKSMLFEVLDLILFDIDDSDNPVLVPRMREKQDEKHDNGRGATGEYYVPKSSFPKHTQIYEYPDSELFLTKTLDFIKNRAPERLFIFPPLIKFNFLPKKFYDKYKRLDFQEIILEESLKELPLGARLGIILHVSTLLNFSKEEFRRKLLKKANLKYVIKLNRLGGEFLAIQFYLLIFENSETVDTIVRFLNIPSDIDISSTRRKKNVITDIRKIRERGGGQTESGYILRNGSLKALHGLLNEITLS